MSDIEDLKKEIEDSKLVEEILTKHIDNLEYRIDVLDSKIDWLSDKIQNI